MIKIKLCLSIIALLLTLPTTLAAQPQHRWSDIERIVAIGDIHGDYDQFITVMRSAELIDSDNNWSGGTTHLVQTGDILDRGPDSKRVMDLLMEIEPQAEKAGGKIHCLIGNHEAMVLSGDLRYVSKGEYRSFGGKEAYNKAFSADGRYGAWIRSHNAIIKINDTLFCHGGLSPKNSGKSLAELNDHIRDNILGQSSSADLLWYRGLAKKSESTLKKELTPILEALHAKRIIVGHDISKNGIKARNRGQAIMIDVGMSRAYGGRAAYLLIEKGEYYAIYPEKRDKIVF